MVYLQVAKSGSWHARAAILRYIQVVVFSNLFSVQREDHSRAVQEIVLDLLCDDQVEVCFFSYHNFVIFKTSSLFKYNRIIFSVISDYTGLFTDIHNYNS